MFKEYDKVIIKATSITGEIIDIYSANGSTYYTVESDEKGVPGGFGEDDSWKLFECLESQLVRSE